METDSLPAAKEKRPKLRWYQYSLRSLMLFVTACAIACSWLAVTIQNQRKQHTAAEVIKKAEGTIKSEQTWLGKLLRDDSLVNVTRVNLSIQSTTDAVLVHLEGLTQLERLSLPKVTDAGLVHLEGLSQLKFLWLSDTRVTDIGLVHLRGLNQLIGLWLNGTQVTDAGLVHLQGLSQLRVLRLDNIRADDPGVKKLQQALPECEIAR